MNSLEVLIIRMLCWIVSSACTHITLRDRIVFLFSYKKSDSMCSKLKRGYSLLHRFQLRYITDHIATCYNQTTVKRLLFLRKCYLLMQLVSLLIILISWGAILPEKIWKIPLIVKFLSIDLPVVFYFFIMTKRGGNGGVIWRWDK